MRLPRKLLFGMMGIGVVSMLGSVGTLAAFTASSDNPSNDFSAGTLQLTDTTGFTSAATSFGSAAANRSGTDPRNLSECSTIAIAQTCSTLIKSVNVSTDGIQPGQYLQATVALTNGGTLPATIAMQVQNAKTNNGNNSLYGSGAAGYSPCPSDIAGVSSPGSSGAQLTAGATKAGYQGAPVPITGCLDIGKALRITIQDGGGGGTGPQCLFGNDTGGTLGATSTNGNDHLQAPLTSGFSVGGTGLSTYVATGSKVGVGSGACDDLSGSAVLGSISTPVLPGANPKDQFGIQTATAGNSSFTALSGITSLIFVPGGGTTTSLINSPTYGGNLRSLPQWAAGESHTFTVTLALPNTGTTQLTDHNHDKYYVGNDNPYQGGAVSFDLYWFAIQ
ncbi:MAG TPA: SipW-dependent-type signal peptide-containing protein [Chloroflexota bacterium]|nr:SipW-dependent-type signal peptide-containing protein [Chloroflexota bacterium]